ncbi:adenylyltransferase/cytidyltransferase family protein [Mumia sp. zg.B53]|uniref:PfkB family carbohydrate kinase n=1 Tax=Mumia sp. zg.B53 TaxID=2855449 RepID=UPI001C6F00DF|nr:PfkB family carbohydrate kinase [Mumia sp. zg.B53]MBW9215197.1 adenylyltransferase/cytidyltransferase family protein [Mumia sp. zg.B53]
MTPRVLVVGEAMLDVDLDGRASRLSPDAPVAVVDDPVERPRPGGAALAAALAASDGARVVLATPLGNDADADRLRALLPPEVEVVALPSDGGTPVKRRVLAAGQVLVRLDTGGTSGSWETPPADLEAAVSAADAVLVADYGRGLTSLPALRELVARAAERVPVVWDPHPRGGRPADNTWLCLPNQSELARLDGSEPTGIGEVGDAARRVRERLGTRALAVTLGERGALLVQGDAPPAVFVVDPVRGEDTCGAGDRFAASATVRLARGDLMSEAVEHAARAAAGFVAAGGATAYGADATPTPSDDVPSHHDGSTARDTVARVRAGGGVVVATGGCFDLLHAGHVATLQAARRLGDCLVVLLNSDASVRGLKGPGRPLVPARDRARVLASLACVDAVVVFEEDRPDAALQEIRPDLWVKGGDYAGGPLPEQQVLDRWGGRSMVLPYLSGRSTTGLVAAANRNA